MLSPCKGEVIDARSGNAIHTIDGMYSRTSTLVYKDGILYQSACGRGHTAQAYQLSHSKVTGKAVTRLDTTKNLVYISNTQQITPDGPGISYESSPRRADCNICR